MTFPDPRIAFIRRLEVPHRCPVVLNYKLCHGAMTSKNGKQSDLRITKESLSPHERRKSSVTVSYKYSQKQAHMICVEVMKSC